MYNALGNLTGKYDVTYYKESEVTEYILDRNEEYEIITTGSSTYYK